MFLVEGGMSFDTRNAVAGARAFQKELVNTGRVAQNVSKSGQDLEENFSRIGSGKTRSALRGLQSALMGAKDGTDAAVAGAKALQIALVKSVGGTAAIGAAGILSDSMRDVGAKIGAAADESARAMKQFNGFSQSLEEGSQRATALAQSADNTVKTLEGLKNAGIFQAGVFKLFGGENILKDLEESTRGLAQGEFAAAAAAERRTAERRAGMTPEEIEADKRKVEEQKRLAEAREKGGPQAEADVAKTIAIENELKLKEKSAKFDKDIADNDIKIAEMKKSAEDKVNQARLDGLTPAARIVELDKESESVAKKLSEIKKTGIYGTEEARKKQLDEILQLEKRSLDISEQKTKALKEQKEEQAEAIKRAKADRERKINVELEERQRQRESARKQAENRAELGRMAQQVKRNELEEQLRKFFGTGAWTSIPENIRNQMLISGVSNQHLSMISRNTAPSDRRAGQRPKSGPGMERPPGYVPEPQGVDANFGKYSMPFGGFGYNPNRFGGRVMRGGTPSTISPDNPYKRTRTGRKAGFEGDLASAIQDLANKIPSAVPV